MTLKHEHQHKSAPKRPPQPKNINFDKNSSKEGMLIDLTSPQQQENTPINGAFENSYLPKMNGISILDAPIDVPTQGYPDDGLNAVNFLDSESSKPEPPPYQSPPTYMNTYGMNKQAPRYASGVTMAHNHYGNLDPFDTSHIATQPMQSNATMQSYSYSTDTNHSRYDSNFVRNSIQSGNNSSELTLINRPKSSATLDLDEIVQNKMASLSPKRSPTPMTAASATAATSTIEFSDTNKPIYSTNDDNSQKTAANSTLSDSLKVNLSSLTLNDTDDFEPQPLSSTTIEQNPKLDHVFLAELEKEIYKNDNAISNVNMKNAQSMDGTAVKSKENTVNAMSNAFNWLKNDFSTANNEMAPQVYQTKMTTTTMTAATTAAATTTPFTQSPAKVYNAESSIKMTNFENPSSNMTLSKKLYNSDISSADMSGYQMGASAASTVNDCNIYSNYGMAGELSNNSKPVHETKFNYVTTTNTISGNGGTAPKNSSYSVASDIYGSMAGGNVYDTVASSASDYYEMIQPNESQTVIYDEVAGDDLRPHRPAPVPPGLSAQQIQRRIERAQKEQSHQLYDNLSANVYANGSSNYGSTSRNHYVYEEINQKSTTMSNSDAIDSDSKETINAASSGTMKNLKIEQLLR